MKILGPTRHPRLNEVGALVLLFAGVALMLSLGSYNPGDHSFNTAAGSAKPLNLVGYAGSYLSDLFFQALGLPAFLIPVAMLALAWKWVRSRAVAAPWVKVIGSLVLILGFSSAIALAPDWRAFHGAIPAGGLLGLLLASSLIGWLNFTGAVLFIATCLVVSVYLVSTFEMAVLARWSRRLPRLRLPRLRLPRFRRRRKEVSEPVLEMPEASLPWRTETIPDEIPIHVLEEPAAPVLAQPIPEFAATEPLPEPARRRISKSVRAVTSFQLPPTALLNEPDARNSFDSVELKETAAKIKAKFEEFNIFGSVVQINPGPVVTTFEFKPEAGIKYSRITTLTEDLCLGLHAESILIERIPGKPTIGIEVPNSKRELISLRQIIESEEFSGSTSKLTLALGKDISGRIKATSLESMPHLLVAGSTGSGKSVMLNSMIMSILYKSTPDEVRMIMIDPKRVEFGFYEGIPHLLTPVITDPRKATNALRNAVAEMERRLKLLASQGVRNIEQFNKKVRLIKAQPRSLFEDDLANPQEELKPLPYILLIIDELADLMMLERANVEESVARLAQMARAVGMHLVLATQRPSVDVITGLIKANFPARMSFRVATRVDSRTVLDVMGAEHLLGKGDMLFLPPGSSRLIRVHGAFVTETEINDVVEYWKRQAAPEYDQTFLLAPAEGGEENGDDPEIEAEEDPMYHDAVRVVVEMGKASTSTLQRRLRLGYGRAARILDRMHKEGIIGPPDGSRPREVLHVPEWYRQSLAASTE